MQCDKARDVLSAYRDGELPVEETRTLETHIATCKVCGDALADYARIGRALKQQGRTAAPAALVARVRASLVHAIGEDEPLPEKAAARRFFDVASWSMNGLGKQAAALVAVALLSALATWWATSAVNRSELIARDVLNAHIRSLLLDTPVQVASSDRHTVRPWFAGRTDFAPAVKDLSQEGFPLVGGRIDYVDERRVSALVYKRRLHVINVFMWPERAIVDGAPSVTTRNGYNILSWSRNGIAYWLISDLNIDELQQLGRLL